MKKKKKREQRYYLLVQEGENNGVLNVSAKMSKALAKDGAFTSNFTNKIIIFTHSSKCKKGNLFTQKRNETLVLYRQYFPLTLKHLKYRHCD